MINRDIFEKDPSKQKLVNEGVASVNDEINQKALEVLRYELETFVCDGQYEAGMVRILQAFLKNINEAQQPSVWVSGFFGSGKSHLIKMLRALWANTAFSDGATAKGIVTLPNSVSDELKELKTKAKQHGGLHAVSGTLGAGAKGSVRLSLLGMIFKSVGLPERYPVAQFLMWLKKQNAIEKVRVQVEALGGDWQEELDNLHVAEILRDALVAELPDKFDSPAECAKSINNQFPKVDDVSNTEMLDSIRLALSNDGVFPLTIICLDEIQQFIADSTDRSIAVQEMVESLAKNIGGKLMVVGTGQTAVTGAAMLARLQGRFTVRVELSDADIESVVRKVVLAKKTDAVRELDTILQKNLGEISRHLSTASIGHRQEDVRFLVPDYPLLPVRRRFWEHALRNLDRTGTDSQLRNQLSIVHKAIQTNLDEKIGNVVPADYLYFDSADKLLQSATLPRKVHEKTMTWKEGSDEDVLTARACGLVFLINKLTASNDQLGLRSNVDTLADLMVTDLVEGSSKLRSALPDLLDNCEILMKVEDEYRIQTEESAAWNDQFQNQISQLGNEMHRIESERMDRIRGFFATKFTKRSVNHGDSNVPREINVVSSSELPKDAGEKITVWVRDGWGTSEGSVLAEAREAGNNSPVIFVFIPKRSSDDLRNQISNYKAASTTLEIRGNPNTPEGIEAKAAIETIKRNADGKINDLLEDLFSGAKVFQGGGTEVPGNDLQEMIFEAANKSVVRLYPQFQLADHAGWGKVYDNAKKGASDALLAVGFDREPEQHPVCKTILSLIGAHKYGNEIRTELESPDKGWSRDAVDGGIQVLLGAGLLRAHDESGKGVDARDLQRSAIGKSLFKLESVTITVKQLIDIRKLFLKAGITAKQGEEHAYVNGFLDKMKELADAAGGSAPKLEIPDTKHLDEIRLESGNEQLLMILSQSEELATNIAEWTERAEKIQSRLRSWEDLRELGQQLNEITDGHEIRRKIDDIEKKRLLLNEPNPLDSLKSQAAQVLREELNRLKGEFEKAWNEGGKRLKSDVNYESLELKTKNQLRAAEELVESFRPKIEVSGIPEIIKTLQHIGLSAMRDRVAALPSRFEAVLLEAAKLVEPKVQRVQMTSTILRTEEDIDAWLDESRKFLIEKLKIGPIIT